MGCFYHVAFRMAARRRSVNDNIVFPYSVLPLSLFYGRDGKFSLFQSVLLLITICFSYSFFFFKFFWLFCNSLRISVKMNGCFHRFRKAYPEKDIKSIGTSNIFPYLCPIIEL